jgi:hypothetical protein
VVCKDETPKQLISGTRVPVKMKSGYRCDCGNCRELAAFLWAIAHHVEPLPLTTKTA